MSHFTVLVIGDDAESQLAPFDENIEMEEYADGLVSQEDKKRFLEFYKENHGENGFFENVYAKWGDDWNGNRWRKEKSHEKWRCPVCKAVNNWRSYHCGQFFKVKKGCGALKPQELNEIWKVYSTYNPNSKWDWYQLGGRWMGYFLLKAGRSGVLGESGAFGNETEAGTADSARKGDIDFEEMRSRAGQNATQKYTEFWGIVDGRAIPRWNDILNKHGRKNIQAARDEYNNIDVIKDLDASERFGGLYFVWNDILDFEESRGDFVEKARQTAITTFAFLHEGKWHQRGEMGWFGQASNEISEDEWNKEFNKFLDALPDDTLLSVYDCHI